MTLVTVALKRRTVVLLSLVLLNACYAKHRKVEGWVREGEL